MRLTPDETHALLFSMVHHWDRITRQDVESLVDTIDALQSDLAAARSETRESIAKFAEEWEGDAKLGDAIRKLDTTHLSEIRELEIRIAEAKLWNLTWPASIGPKSIGQNRVADLEQQLESLRGKGKG